MSNIRLYGPVLPPSLTLCHATLAFMKAFIPHYPVAQDKQPRAGHSDIYLKSLLGHICPSCTLLGVFDLLQHGMKYLPVHQGGMGCGA